MSRYSDSKFRNVERLIEYVKDYFVVTKRRLQSLFVSLSFLDINERNIKKEFQNFSYNQGQTYYDLIQQGLDSLKLYEQEFEKIINESTKQQSKGIIYRSEEDYKANGQFPRKFNIIADIEDKNEQIEMIKAYLEHITDSKKLFSQMSIIKDLWEGKGLEVFIKDVDNLQKDILEPLEDQVFKYEKYLQASEIYENENLREFNANLMINSDFLKAPIDERLNCIDSNPRRQAVKNACMQAMTYLDTLRDLSIELVAPHSKLRTYDNDYIMEKVDSLTKMIEYNFEHALSLDPDKLEFDSFMLTEKEITARLKDAEYLREQIQNDLQHKLQDEQSDGIMAQLKNTERLHKRIHERMQNNAQRRLQDEQTREI